MFRKYKFNTAESSRNLGLALGLSPTILNEIEADHNRANRFLQEVLSAWLRQVTEPPPSWVVLEEALEHVEEKYVAEGVSKCEFLFLALGLYAWHAAIDLTALCLAASLVHYVSVAWLHAVCLHT